MRKMNFPPRLLCSLLGHKWQSIGGAYDACPRCLRMRIGELVLPRKWRGGFDCPPDTEPTPPGYYATFAALKAGEPTIPYPDRTLMELRRLQHLQQIIDSRR